MAGRKLAEKCLRHATAVAVTQHSRWSMLVEARRPVEASSRKPKEEVPSPSLILLTSFITPK